MAPNTEADDAQIVTVTHKEQEATAKDQDGTFGDGGTATVEIPREHPRSDLELEVELVELFQTAPERTRARVSADRSVARLESDAVIAAETALSELLPDRPTVGFIRD